MLDPCDLTAEDFHLALMDLLPVGWAWPRDPESVLSGVWRGVADEAARVQARACALLEESDPETAAELLVDWERAFGLPDPCDPADQTAVERRAALLAKIRSLGGASIAYFVGLAADRGYEIEIAEHRPFVCARSACGYQSALAEIGSPLMRFVWTVALHTPRLVWFRTGGGGGQVGVQTHLTIERAEEIECLFARVKPVHSEIVYDYSDDLDLVGLAAMTFSANESLTLGTGNRVEAWASGGLQNITLTGGSEHITAAGGVVAAAGSGQLYYDTLAPIDLALGFSVFAVCRVPDAQALIGTSKRLFMINAGAATVFNAIMPSAVGQILLSTNGGNVSAAGISDADMESFAVWGFVADLVTGTGRILRNGATLASGPLTADFSGVTRYTVLLNAAIEVQGALVFDRGSPEIDADATAHLENLYGL